MRAVMTASPWVLQADLRQNHWSVACQQNMPIAYLRSDLMGAHRALSTAAVIAHAKPLLLQAHEVRIRLEPRGLQTGPVPKPIHMLIDRIHASSGLTADQFDPIGGEWAVSADGSGLISSLLPSYIFALVQGQTELGCLSTTTQDMHLMSLSITAYEALALVISPTETIGAPELICRLDLLLGLANAAIDFGPARQRLTEPQSPSGPLIQPLLKPAESTSVLSKMSRDRHGLALDSA